MLLSIIILSIVAIALMLAGLRAMDNARSVTVDCATPGQANRDYKGIRYVK